MQNYCKTIGALAAASALAAGNASAEVQYNLHTGYSSTYMFRGLNVGGALVETGLDASTQVQGFGLSGGAWFASFDGRTGAPTPFATANQNELDLYAQVDKDFGFVKLAVGGIYYDYPQGQSNRTFSKFTGFGTQTKSSELYVSLSRDFGFVNASLTYYGELKGDNNGYTEFALSHSFVLSPCVSLAVSSNVGYLAENNDFTAWTTKASLDWAFAEHAKLSPFVQYSVALVDKASSPTYLGSDNELVFGSMLSVSF